MKFTVQKKDVSDVLSKIQSLTGRKSNLAITSNILIKATGSNITIAATDLETGFEGEYPAKVESDGEIAISARKFYEIIRDFPIDDINIHEIENPTLSELAEKLKITKPSTSVMVDRLEEHGYIQKIKSDSDRRSAHVHLTTKGDKAAHLHIDLHRKFASLLTQSLTDSEKDILVVLLNKAIKSIE